MGSAGRAIKQMGKRKSSQKKVTVRKNIYKLPKMFPCPYCMLQDGVKITLSKKDGTASLRCRKCAVGAESIKINKLTEPVDVYNQWMDSARAANTQYNPEVQRERRLRERLEVDETIEYDTTALRRVEANEESSELELSEDSDI